MGFFPTDVGAQLKTLRGISPQSSESATVNGIAIDRRGFQSCVLTGITGAVSGSPTAISVVFKLQESADGSAGWIDIDDASVTVTEADAVGEKDVNLAGVKGYIRTVAVVSFIGGTTPSILLGATVALGGAVIKPV